MINFRQINTADKNLQLIQDNIQALAGEICKSPFVDGKLLKTTVNSAGQEVALSLVSGQDNLISHGLGRTPQMWALARQFNNAVVWEATTSALADANGTAQSANDSLINLQCSANCTIYLWIN